MARTNKCSEATLIWFVGWRAFLEPFLCSLSKIKNKIKSWNQIFFSDLDESQSVNLFILSALKWAHLSLCHRRNQLSMAWWVFIKSNCELTISEPVRVVQITPKSRVKAIHRVGRTFWVSRTGQQGQNIFSDFIKNFLFDCDPMELNWANDQLCHIN